MLDFDRISKTLAVADTLNLASEDPYRPETHHPAPISFDNEVEPTPWPRDCMPDGLKQAVEAIADEVQAPVSLAAFAVVSAVSHLAMRLTDANLRNDPAMLQESLDVLARIESAWTAIAVAPMDRNGSAMWGHA